MQSPLALHHERSGAILNQAKVPLRYTSMKEEYSAVRNSAGIADISHVGRLAVTGKDREQFLNGLLTNDITKAKENMGVHSVLLNPKARVLADLYVHNEGNRIIIDAGERPSEQVKNILDQFIITEDVKIQNLDGSTVLLTIQGPSSNRMIRQILKLNVDDLRPLQNRPLGPSLVISRDRTGYGGYDLIIPKDEAEAVWQGFLLTGEQGPHPIGLDALEILRLESGFPKYGVDVDENTIVLEAGYQDAISFTKGCYMGQEVVARATHIGRVNRRLVQLQVDAKETIQPGSSLVANGQSVGSVTSSAFSPANEKTFALGYVGRDFAAVGKEVLVPDAGKGLTALVSKVV